MGRKIRRRGDYGDYNYGDDGLERSPEKTAIERESRTACMNGRDRESH